MQITEALIQDLKNFTLAGIACPLVFVEGGSYDRGSMEYEDEQPILKVTVPSFFIAKYQLTQGLYKAVMNDANPSRFKGNARPIENISWYHIKDEFLPAWNKHSDVQSLVKSHFPTLPNSHDLFRLPSETEWEYAAKGGKYSEGYKYAGSDDLEQVGWNSKNSGGETKPVGLLDGNELGLHDMSGNVYEWCADDYYKDYSKNPNDGSAWIDSPNRASYRVMRGGSSFSDPIRCRPSDRGNDHPVNAFDDLGFRLVFGFLVQSVGD